MVTNLNFNAQRRFHELHFVGSAQQKSQAFAEAQSTPRYTSYPTADRFVEAFTHTEFERYLEASQITAMHPMSLYVHFPYCRSLCYYCACNKQVTSKYQPEPFIDALCREMEMVSNRLQDAPFTQMHWGGGTPTFLNPNDIRIVFEQVQQFFIFTDNAEYAIEIDPRTVDKEKIQLLASLGFTRTSLGIQDFDIEVQKKINRIQPLELVSDVLSFLRRSGITSINFDLITGLPAQSVESFSKTLNHVVELKPDRLALYNYAHLPERFKAQRLIDKNDIPNLQERQAIFAMATEKLLTSGYQYIGMDHFALPNDELAVAQRQGTLHRNFQGYTTQGENNLVGLGPSAISKVGGCYSQNTRSLRDYLDTIEQGVLPVVRGIELSRDDLLRRSVISAVMCQNRIDKQSVEIAHLINFDDYFQCELRQLEKLQEKGWVTLSSDSLCITQAGRRTALRDIACVFDKYLQQRKSFDATARVL